MSENVKYNSRLRQIAEVARIELREITTDSGVLLIMVFAIFIYSSLYGAAYGSEVLREVPIVVVDQSQSPSSRRLTALLGDGSGARVAFAAPDMAEARSLLYDRKAYGVVYIPADYEERLLAGEQADVAMYCDASYFLIYRVLFGQMVSALTLAGAEVEVQRVVGAGVDPSQAQAVVEPLRYESHTLFNPSLGYGIFVMPAVIMVIIQQTLLMGIGIIGGTWRERNLYEELMPDGGRPSLAALIVGKVLSYGVVSGVTAALALTIPYYLLGYPMRGSIATLAALIAPYILACTMLGIALSTLFRRRESAILWLLWSSIPILMLSGVSYPASAMPKGLTLLGSLLPSSHAVEAFIRVRDMGASLAEIAPSMVGLWVQVALYGAIATLLLAREINPRKIAPQSRRFR